MEGEIRTLLSPTFTSGKLKDVRKEGFLSSKNKVENKFISLSKEWYAKFGFLKWFLSSHPKRDIVRFIVKCHLWLHALKTRFF